MVGITIVLLLSANPSGSAPSATAGLQLRLLQRLSLQQPLTVNRSSPTAIKSRRKHTMAEAHRKSWRDLCSAALEAKDPDELLKIVQDRKSTRLNSSHLGISYA